MTKTTSIAATLVLVSLCLAGSVSANYAQSFSDLWDVSNGIAIIANSGAQFGSIYDMFGASSSYYAPEIGRTIFADWMPLNYRHCVEWQTAQTVTVGRVALWAEHDSGSYGRSFNRFSLEAWDGTGYFTVLDTPIALPYTYAHGVQGLVIDAVLSTPVTASRFMASFYQGTEVAWASGPRVLELDAFGPVPEPSSIAALAIGLLSLAGTRRRRP